MSMTMKFDMAAIAGALTERLIKQALLERLAVHSRAVIDRRPARLALNDPRVFVDALTAEADRMIMGLTSYVWQEVIQNETVTLKLDCAYPATWCQHFKQRWFPGWALRRWPVRMTNVHKEESHRFQTAALFPEFKYESPPGCGPYVIKTMVERR